MFVSMKAPPEATMRVMKDANGKFTIEEEPFILEGEAAKIFRAQVCQTDAPPTEAHRSDLENCVRLYTDAWTKRGA